MQETSLCSQSKVVGGGREGGPLDSEAQPVVTCYGKIQIIKKILFLGNKIQSLSIHTII